jgi:fluoroquinolone transport system ATP-binding protein
MHELEPADGSVGSDVIEVRGLTFTYPRASTPTLHGMDFAVGGGEIFGFLGPTAPANPPRRSC